MEEIWKDIEGFEQRYLVSNLGNVKSLARYTNIKERILRQSISRKNGYLVVCLYKANGYKRNYRVNILVANAFVVNENNKPFVNHKDGNKLNNHYSNLEWCTHYENMQHAKSSGLLNVLTGNMNSAKLTLFEVSEIRREYDSMGIRQVELCKKYNIKPTTCSNIIHRKIYV